MLLLSLQSLFSFLNFINFVKVSHEKSKDEEVDKKSKSKGPSLPPKVEEGVQYVLMREVTSAKFIMTHLRRFVKDGSIIHNFSLKSFN